MVTTNMEQMGMGHEVVSTEKCSSGLFQQLLVIFNSSVDTFTQTTYSL